MTLTKGEYDRYRGEGASESNGSVPANAPPRRCEVCGTALAPRQQRACGRSCAAALGQAAQARKQQGATPRPRRSRRPKQQPHRDAASGGATDVPDAGGTPSLSALLAGLPPEVIAVELAGGWRCVRAAAEH